MKCDFKLCVELLTASELYENTSLIHRPVLMLHVLDGEKLYEESLAAWGWSSQNRW